MSYTRGDIYIWADSSSVHFWNRHGHDNWNQSGWNQESKPNENPSGVKIPFEVADEFVAMRSAQLLDNGTLPNVMRHAINKWKFNGGCSTLSSLESEIQSADTAIDIELKRVQELGDILEDMKAAIRNKDDKLTIQLAKRLCGIQR
ncbi:MAG TPA: hypothetical protein VKD65_15585 [Candidatus Angelobacter sp.]|nr:hypothetical protein [Candidatus Angelobacter sp.]